jgi:hypothetical protein
MILASLDSIFTKRASETGCFAGQLFLKNNGLLL